MTSVGFEPTTSGLDLPMREEVEVIEIVNHGICVTNIDIGGQPRSICETYTVT